MTTTRPDTSSPWWKSRFVLLATASLGLICLFFLLVSEVNGHETETFDRMVRDWAFAHRPPLLVKIFEVVTLFGQASTLAVIATIVALFLVRRGALVRPMLIAAFPFFLSPAAEALKNWYEIPRPPAGQTNSALVFGFPSGHATLSTAMFLVIAYVLARESGARRFGWTIAIVVPLAVGISRIYLDMHWASQVIGGWMIGAFYGVVVCALYELGTRNEG